MKNILILGLTLSLFVGCTTPDTKKFAEASTVLASGIKRGGSETVHALQLARFQAEADSLKHEWSWRSATLDALVIYTNHLANIQADSNASKNGVDELSAATSELATTLGQTLPAASISLVQVLTKEAIEIREFHKISEALGHIGGSMEELLKLLLQDVQSARNIYVDAMSSAAVQRSQATEDIYDIKLEEAVKRLTESVESGSGHAKEIAALEGELRQLRDAQAAAVQIREVERQIQSLKVASAQFDEDVKKLDSLYPVFLRMETEVKLIEEDARSIIAKRQQGDAFYTELSGACDIWIKSYRDLRLAFEKNKTPDFTLLYSKALEIKGLVDQL